LPDCGDGKTNAIGSRSTEKEEKPRGYKRVKSLSKKKKKG